MADWTIPGTAAVAEVRPGPARCPGPDARGPSMPPHVERMAGPGDFTAAMARVGRSRRRTGAAHG